MGVALLAPVPSIHLQSAVETCRETGRVAFGSKSPDVFDKMLRDFGSGVPAYIYSSSHHGPPYHYVANGKASLCGILHDVVQADPQGRHPNRTHRPPSTFEPERRGLEAWWCYWEVRELEPLPKSEQVPLTRFIALGQSRPLPSGFVPRGPMIVRAPFIA